MHIRKELFIQSSESVVAEIPDKVERKENALYSACVRARACVCVRACVPVYIYMCVCACMDWKKNCIFLE